MSVHLLKGVQGGLSPWQVKGDSDDEQTIDEFCHDRIPRSSQKYLKPLSERIDQSYKQTHLSESQKLSSCKKGKTARPKSQSVRKSASLKKAIIRLSGNKENK